MDKLFPALARLALCLWASAAALFLFALGPGPRVGDGSDYLAQLLAWRDTGRPYLTAAALDSYRQLYAAGRPPALVAPERLLNYSLAIDKGDGTYDFNHFWFYSFLAWPAARVSGRFSVDPSWAFLFLHWVALLAAGYAVKRVWGGFGLAALTALWLLSPALWWSNKVHCEFLIFCCSSAGLALLAAGRPAACALALAIPATQYPPFALLSLSALGFWLVRTDRGVKERGGFLWTGLAVIVLLAHPLYYLWRQGMLTPQAHIGYLFSSWPCRHDYLSWLYDPDIGLWPRWPLGLILLCGGLARWPDRWKVPAPPLWFILSYVIILSLGQAFAVYKDMGGTAAVSRYSAWFLCLFLLPTLQLLHPPFNRRYFLVLALAAAGAAHSLWTHWPNRPERRLQPTGLSQRLADDFPGFYDPPPQVFLLRHAGQGEDRQRLTALPAAAAAGCRKLLLADKTLSGPPPGSGKPAGCQQALDPALLWPALAKRRPSSSCLGYSYFNLSASEVQGLAPRLAPETIVRMGEPASGRFLASGWSEAESWGRWTAGEKAGLAFFLEQPLPAARLKLCGQAFIGSSAPEIVFRLNGRSIRRWQTSNPARQLIDLELGQLAAGYQELTLDIAHPASPQEQGLSSDPRRLGLGLCWFQLTRPLAAVSADQRCP